MQPEVTCILTSCGRFDLLRITLESFIKHNTYPIKEFIIYEDSGKIQPYEMFNDYPFLTWIVPNERKGQICALDTLWQQVTTPYAFTMEDDWEFLQPGFIEASMKIIEWEPQVLQVWLNPLEDQNVHQITWYDHWVKKPTGNEHMNYGILSNSTWSGTRFNPALKRKADYDLIAPFSQHTTWNPAKPWKSEADISKVYHKLGFKGAIFNKQYIKHIGENRHVK